MAKILFEDRWFEEVASEATYESAFENIVKAHSSVLWPQFHTIPFKTTIYTEEGAAKADLALIELKYREWWVVEIEMAHHNFQGHVFRQVRILSHADYGQKEAAILCRANPALDDQKVSVMMKGKQPRVLVVVNKACPQWVQPLSRFDSHVAIFEIFRSERNEYIFRVNGDHPMGPTEVISACRYDPLLPRFLVVESPAALGIPTGQKISILFNNSVTEWERIDVSDKVWLLTRSPNPLSPDSEYEILRQEDGQMLFRQKQT